MKTLGTEGRKWLFVPEYGLSEFMVILIAIFDLKVDGLTR
jgi:hypothetical protein